MEVAEKVSKIVMMQSVIYREILEEGEQIGEQRGRLAVLQRQITRRFGVIPADVIEQLSALSLPELDQLSEALLDFNAMDDLIRWLGKHCQ